MSWVNIKRRKNPAVTAFKRVMCLFAGIVLAVGTFSILDGDGYLFLLQQNTTVGAMISTMVTTVTDTLGITSNSKGGTVGSSGINTLLISKMQEGYAKDYLEICLKNEAGELDTTKRKSYAEIATIVGINISETGFYNSGKGANILPDSDIPDNIVYNSYGSAGKTLYDWNKNSNPHKQGVGGQFAYTSDNITWTAIDTKSKYNKGTKTVDKRGKGVGDGYSMPDSVCGLNDYLARGIKELNVSSTSIDNSAYSAEIKGIACATAHNLGSGILRELYGAATLIPQSYLGATTEKETMERMNTFVGDMVKAVEGIPDKSLKELLKNFSGEYTWETAAICLISQGWYISPEMHDHMLKGRFSSAGVKCWNYVNPDDKVSNVAEFKSKLDTHTKTLSELTGYSETECDNIYGTLEGSYSERTIAYGESIKHPHTSQAEYGTAFKLLDGTTNALKNKKGAKRVIAMQGIPLQHAFTAAFFGKRVAARMMIYAGIDAADVYITSGDSGQTTAGGSSSSGSNDTFTANTKIIDKLKSHGCDVSKLTKNNYAILKSADRADGKAYVWASSHGHGYCTKVHDSYDCSSFISHAIAGSGIEGVKEGMKGFPDSTKTYPSQSNSKFNMKPPGSWKTSELYPGDIFTDIGSHTCMFVGMKNGNICTIEARGKNYGCGYFDHPNRNGYGVYRLKGIHNPDHF